MATPTSLPASFSTGAVLTAAQMNDLRGAFRILQIVDASTSTTVGSTSTTYADTNLTATITPSSTSSKILVIVSQNCFTDAATTGLGIRLLRGATVLQTWFDLCFGNNSGNLNQPTFMYMDSPNTTSATTYKTQFNRRTGTGNVSVQVNSTNGSSTIILCEVSA